MLYKQKILGTVLGWDGEKLKPWKVAAKSVQRTMLAYWWWLSIRLYHMSLQQIGGVLWPRQRHSLNLPFSEANEVKAGSALHATASLRQSPGSSKPVSSWALDVLCQFIQISRVKNQLPIGKCFSNTPLENYKGQKPAKPFLRHLLWNPFPHPNIPPPPERGWITAKMLNRLHQDTGLRVGAIDWAPHRCLPKGCHSV